MASGMRSHEYSQNFGFGQSEMGIMFRFVCVSGTFFYLLMFSVHVLCVRICVWVCVCVSDRGRTQSLLVSVIRQFRVISLVHWISQ